MFNGLKIASTIGLSSLLLIATPNAEAALINTSFTGSIDSGLLVGETYNGSFTYDNSTLANSGFEYIGLSSLTFNFLSSVFTLADADFTATADFLDGSFLGVSYSVTSIDPSFRLVSAAGSGLPDDLPYLAYETVAGDSGFGSVNISAVPIPGAIWLLGSGLGLFGLVGRKNRKDV